MNIEGVSDTVRRLMSIGTHNTSNADENMYLLCARSRISFSLSLPRKASQFGSGLGRMRAVVNVIQPRECYEHTQQSKGSGDRVETDMRACPTVIFIAFWYNCHALRSRPPANSPSLTFRYSSFVHCIAIFAREITFFVWKQEEIDHLFCWLFIHHDSIRSLICCCTLPKRDCSGIYWDSAWHEWSLSAELKLHSDVINFYE